MLELGGYQELAPSARWVGSALFALSLAVIVYLERLQLLLRADEPSRWWASNGRDVINALAVATMSFGLSGVGFTGPIALAIAATLVIVVSLVEGAFARRPTQLLTAATFTALGLGLFVLLAPHVVHALFVGLIEALFSGLPALAAFRTAS